MHSKTRNLIASKTPGNSLRALCGCFIALLVISCWSGLASAGGSQSIRGGIGYDVIAGGAALYGGYGYTFATSSVHALELTVEGYHHQGGGSYAEDDGFGSTQGVESTRATGIAFGVNALLNYHRPGARFYPIVGAGLAVVNAAYKDTYTEFGRGGDRLYDDGDDFEGSAVASTFRFGLGVKMSQMDLRFEVPIAVTLGAPATGFAVPLTVSAGVTF